MPEKLKMHSPDLIASNIDCIAELFPNCVTEAAGENGLVTRLIDFDLLRQELSGDIVEGPLERYHLNWPGKREAMLAANAPIAKTLRPCREESVDFDTTKNLFIEGDNLEALKLLQETYLGKVKMIYIDPPYNTGNDFIYDDDFAEDADAFLLRSEQVEESGVRLIANSNANGRFHSDWLSMMLPRLKLARNVLREDGCIFISIDDNEISSLRKLCDEIFGPSNFIATIVWQKRYVSNVTAKWLSDMHDYVLVYAKQSDLLTINDWKRTTEQESAYRNPDDDPRGVWRAQDLSASKPYEAGKFTITGPNGDFFTPPPNRYWRCNREQFDRWCKDKRIWWGVNGDARPMLKAFLSESTRGIKPHTWWGHEFAGHNKEATLELKALFDGDAPFDTPKPVKLMKKILELVTSEGDIVMDFFAGSATFAQAVLEMGNARFIAVQAGEMVQGIDSSPKFQTIAEVAKERIRRICSSQSDKNRMFAEDYYSGFRVLKIDSSNMKDVYYSPQDTSQAMLSGLVDNIKPDRTGEDLLFQVLLDCGVDLGLPLKRETLDNCEVFIVNESKHTVPDLIACFEVDLPESLVTTIADKKPLRAVFRDQCYATDAEKINVEQIFKQLSPNTQLKSL